MKFYTQGGDIYAYPEKRINDFSININPWGMSETIAGAMTAAIEDCHNYPDPFCRRLKPALAGFEGVPEEQVVLANGSTELLYRIAFRYKNKPALIAVPCFGEFESALRAADCPMDFYQLDGAQYFTVNIDILKHIPENGLVFLSNPNNPTGMVIPDDILAAIIKETEKKNTLLVIDEAYNDFLARPERNSCKLHLPGKKHLVILKSFSHIYAMPGVRLGYALTSNSELATKIQDTTQPWGISVLAQAAGLAALTQREFIVQSRRFVEQERAYLLRGLTTLGLTVFPSRTNYILFQSKNTNLEQQLLEQDIMIMNCESFRGLGPGYYRVAVKTRKDNTLLLDTLKRYL